MKICAWMVFVGLGSIVASRGLQAEDRDVWYSAAGENSQSASNATTDFGFYLAQQPGAAPSTPARPPGTSTTPRQPTTPTPRTTRPDANALALGPSYNNQGVPYRTSGYSVASIPNMIGDTLGVGYFFMVEGRTGTLVNGGNVPIGDGSIKISEDCSPLPVDRVFFDYNHFHNALLSANGDDVSLNRYTFGLEKTFFDGNSSLELKAPLDAGLNDVQFVTGSTADNQGTLFGTLSLTPKVLLFREEQIAMSAGLAIGLPTAPNAELHSETGEVIRVFDDSVHLAPFLGLLLQPNDRWFSITYLQLDFDAGGNRVEVSGSPEGRIHVPTLMYVDCSVGYWLFYNRPGEPGANQFIAGLAPVVELHYTTTLQDAQPVGSFIQPISSRVDILNITGGLFFKIGPTAGLMVGGVAPLRTRPSDKEFDAEVLVQFNRWF